MLPQELAPAPQGCRTIAVRLAENVQDRALAGDRSPQPEALARDPDRHFGEVRLRAWARSPPAPVPGEPRSERETPTPDGLVRDLEPPFGRELRPVAVAQGEPERESPTACRMMSGGNW